MKPRPLMCLVALTAAAVAVAGLAGSECPPDRPLPDLIETATAAGVVSFPHDLHVDGMELPCVQCHHDTRAGSLDVPHPEYFEEMWDSCSACHNPATETDCPGSCSDCHHESPASIADETLSSKVVIHRSCWQCHDVGSGAEASSSCEFCHQTPEASS